MIVKLCLLAAAVPFVAMVQGCSGTGSNAGDLDSAKDLIGTSYNNAVNNADAAAYAGLFMDDVMWAPPGEPVVRDRAQIQRVMESRFERMSFDVAITPAEAEVMGDTAYVIVNAEGTVTSLEDGSISPVRVTGMFILKWGEEGWKIYRQIYNDKG